MAYSEWAGGQSREGRKSQSNAASSIGEDKRRWWPKSAAVPAPARQQRRSRIYAAGWFDETTPQWVKQKQVHEVESRISVHSEVIIQVDSIRIRIRAHIHILIIGSNVDVTVTSATYPIWYYLKKGNLRTENHSSSRYHRYACCCIGFHHIRLHLHLQTGSIAAAAAVVLVRRVSAKIAVVARSRYP